MNKQKLQNLAIYKKIKLLYEKYERYLVPGMLLLGFVFDLLTFQALTLHSALVLLSIYAAITGLTIAYIAIYEEKGQVPTGLFSKYLRLAAPLVQQFLFGALLSASLIFYLFAGAVSVSWPILLVVAALMISNETLRHYYLIPAVQLVVYYFILFSLFLLILPMYLRSIGMWIFVGAGSLAMALIILLLLFLTKHSIGIKKSRYSILTMLASVFVIMHALYFLNIIPPVPLSLRSHGMYHSLVRDGAQYRVTEESESFIKKVFTRRTMHIKPGDTLYGYSAIFAPAELQIPIYHHWYYKDTETGKWVSFARPRFFIVGGRQEGYRGYSYIAPKKSGTWKIDIETERGQVIGRMKFNVDFVTEYTPRQELLVQLY